jgi:hypothetical protein
VLDFVCFGSSLSMRSFSRIGSSVSILGCTFAGSCRSLSVVKFTIAGSAISIRSTTRLSSSTSIMGHSALGSTLSLRASMRTGSGFSI